MARKLLLLATLLLAASTAAILALDGGGGADGVHVVWSSERSAVALAADGHEDGANPVKTIVYVTNNSDSVLHNAVIRLSEHAGETEIGLGIGTVTSVSTDFEGKARVWKLGDLEAGKRYGLPIGLWFTSQYVGAAPDTLVLTVELRSPDLREPVRSNELALTLEK